MTDFDRLWQTLADELKDVVRRYRERIATLPVTTKTSHVRKKSSGELWLLRQPGGGFVVVGPMA